MLQRQKYWSHLSLWLGDHSQPLQNLETALWHCLGHWGLMHLHLATLRWSSHLVSGLHLHPHKTLAMLIVVPDFMLMNGWLGLEEAVGHACLGTTISMSTSGFREAIIRELF